MMKKALLLLVAVVVGMTCRAQSESETAVSQPVLRYGYLSYEAALQSLPEYAAAQADIAQLRAKYEAEQKRVANDFNKKYEEFLDGQQGYPKTILQKRQAELQEMLDRNIAFKKESQRLLADAEQEALQPARQRLAEVLATLGEQNGLAFILNTDGNAMPWLNSAMGIDLTEVVSQALQ